jgi:plastocyanin
VGRGFSRDVQALKKSRALAPEALPVLAGSHIEDGFRKFFKRRRKMKKFKLICVLVVMLAAALALGAAARSSLAGSASDKPASAAEIKIDNFSFGPATITVPAGTTITWKNNDDVPHVVSSDDNKMFKSKALDTDDRFSFTFTNPGTYNYYCAIHPKMTAKIVVQ